MAKKKKQKKKKEKIIFFFFFFVIDDRDPKIDDNLQIEKYDALIAQERNALEGAKREIDQYRTKVEGLSHDVFYHFRLILFYCLKLYLLQI